MGVDFVGVDLVGVDLVGMNLYMMSIKYCCSIGTKRREPPYLVLSLGTIFPMLSGVVSSNPADLVLSLYVLEGHSHLLVSHIRPGKLGLLFRINARFL